MSLCMYMYNDMQFISCQVACKVLGMTIPAHQTSSTPEGHTSPPSAVSPSTVQADALLAALSRMRGRRGFRQPGDGTHRHAHDRLPHNVGDSAHPGHGAGGAAGHERGRGGPALLRMLSTLAHAEEPLTVSALAEQIGVDQPRASRLVQQAVEHGHVAREADPNDARRTRVRLTETGERTVHGFRSRQRDEASTALAALTPTEREALVSLVTKLAAAWPER